MTVAYQGGRLLSNIEVVNIFYGLEWAPNGQPVPLINDIEQFMRFLLGSPYILQLHEYSVPGYTIGNGFLKETIIVSKPCPASRKGEPPCLFPAGLIQYM